MVTPIAYDLKFALTLPPELEVQRLYGIPGDPNGSPRTSFDVKTSFISRRKGAIVVRVQEKQGQAAGQTSGNVRLQYTPERAVLDGPPSDVTVPIAGIAASEQPSFSGVGVRKAVFLVNQLEGMKKACALWHEGKRAEAKTAVDALLVLMKSESPLIGDAALDPELKLVEKLAANMK
jgi:Ca-activated chloride channel family protein